MTWLLIDFTSSNELWDIGSWLSISTDCSVLIFGTCNWKTRFRCSSAFKSFNIYVNFDEGNWLGSCLYSEWTCVTWYSPSNSILTRIFCATHDNKPPITVAKAGPTACRWS